MGKRIKGITVEINGSTTGLEKALKGATSSISKTQAALRDVNRLLKIDPKNTELLAQKQKLLSQAVEETKKKLDTLKSASEQAAKTVGKYDAWKNAYTPIQEEIGKTQEKIKSLKQKMSELEKAGKVDTAEYRALGEELKNEENCLQSLKQKAKEVSDEFGNPISHEQYDALQREIIETEQNLKSLEKQAKEATGTLGKTLQETGQRLKDMGSKTVEVGKGFSTHVTAPLTAVGAASIAAFNEVDAGMDIIEQKTGATGKALLEMENSAKRIASNIPTNFEIAGAAIGEVNTRFGLTGEALEKLSEKFIKFADLNGTDVSNSIDNTQKVLTAFGLTAEDAGALLDTMNAVGQRTGINMDELSSSMVKNSASLQQMGFSAADAANFLGNVEMSGADTSQVMSGLTKALANATAEGKPMNAALAEIQNSMVNAGSETEGLQVAYDLFGKKAGAAIYQACKTGSLSFETLGTSMNDNLGNVDDTYERTLDGTDKFKTGMNRLKVAGAELGEAIGDTLAPMIEKAGNKITEVTKRFSEMSPHTKDMIVKIGLIAAVLGPALVIIGTLISSIGTIVGAIGTFISFLGGLSGAASAAGGGIALFSGPLLPLVGIIGGVVGAGVLLYKNWDTIKEKAGEIKDKISGKWKEIKKETKESWNHAADSVKESLSKIKEKTKTSIENARDTVKAGWENVKSNTNQAWQNIQNNIQAKGGGIKGVIGTAMEGYKNIWKVGFGAINTITGGKLEGALSTVKTKMSAVKSAFSSKIQEARNTVSSGVGKIKGIFDKLKLKLPPIKIPKIKLPHFSVTGSFSLNPPKVPKISVKWNKDGAILSGAQIFGRVGNTFLGGGEKGDEAVLPLDSFYNRLETMLKKALTINIPDFDNMMRTECVTNVDVYVGNEKLDAHIVKTVEKEMGKKHRAIKMVKGI